jgi:hypothetical protein
MNLSKLTRHFRGVADLRNVFKRERFVSELFRYLESAEISHRKEGTLYVILNSIDVTDAFLCREVSVGFKLHKEKPKTRISPEELQRDDSEEEGITEYYLTPGTTITGEQILFFTFTSLESLEHNVGKFRRFINQSHIPPQTIRELNREYWDKLRSVREHLERQAPPVFDEENLAELWQRARYYTNCHWVAEEPQDALDLKEIIERVVVDVIGRVRRPLPGLAEFVCRKIDTRLMDPEK